jgi:hypothetical protein
MPTTEGSLKTGWLVLFTAEETKRIAEPVGDFAGPAAAIAGLIPELVVSKIVGLGLAGLTFIAKKATKDGKLLGVYIRGANPLRTMF